MNRKYAMLVGLGLVAGSLALAQTQPVAPPSGQKTLAATMNVYVFPSSGQKPDQQSMDEGECYNWAASNTGTDPFQISKTAEQQKQQAAQAQQQAAKAGQGAGAAGAVKGAAAGAVIGEISDSHTAEKGAATGAAVGLIAGRRRGKAAQQQASQQATAQAQQGQQATAAQMDGFKKAFSVCLEAKKYMVKY